MPEEIEDLQLDVILSVLENPIRRKILRKLSRDNNYPLQLSKELHISQQAIMKHLKVLEENDFVESYEERSSKGGPPRKVFTPRKRYSVRIDIGPHTYNEVITSFEEYGGGPDVKDMSPAITETQVEVNGKLTGEMKEDVVAALPAFTDPILESLRRKLDRAICMEDDIKKLSELRLLISNMNVELRGMEMRRRRLLALRERAFEDTNKIISSISHSYVEREAYSLFVKDEISDMDMLSDMLNIRHKVLKEIMKEFEDLLGS